MFENTFHFCVSVRLLNEKRECSRCCRMLKSSIDRHDHTTTPVVLSCSNRPCLKDYYSIRDGTVFDSLKLPSERENSLAAGVSPRTPVRAYSTPQTVAGSEGTGCPLPNNPAADWAWRASILDLWASVHGS